MDKYKINARLNRFLAAIGAIPPEGEPEPSKKTKADLVLERMDDVDLMIRAMNDKLNRILGEPISCPHMVFGECIHCYERRHRREE